MRALREDVIYLSVTAFGDAGPLKEQPGFDPLLQAHGGIMSVTGHPDGPPARVGTSVIDFGTGVWAALSVLAALRSRPLGAWLGTDAGLVLTYAGALIAALLPDIGLTAVVLGVAWYLAGCTWQWRRAGIGAVLAHMGELLERLLQLAVNTLSFLRVGAFALAHAGLSVAVMTLAEAAPGIVAGAIVLVLGNVAILVLEGLVVAVQTTRLILFEFFIRFFKAEGRPFHPMSPPMAG